MADPETRAERDALQAAAHVARIHGLDEPPERPYLEALPAAHRDIRDRFLQGLLRGTPEGLPRPFLVGGDGGDSTDEAFPFGRTPDEAFPFDRPPDEAFPFDRPPDVTVSTGGSNRLALLPMPATERTLSIPVEAIGGFDRVRVGDPVVLVGADGVEPVTHPVELVAPLDREGAFVDDEQAAVIEREVAESVANLALAHLAEDVQRRRAVGPALALSTGAVRAAGLGADLPAYLERLVTRGHPFHPGAKIRRGMSPADGLAYAPEFAASIPLRFVAIHRTVARRVAVDDRALTDRLFDAFDGLEAAVERSLPSPGAVDDHAVVAVHPWQYRHVVHDRYASQIDRGYVVPVDGFAAPATPLLNLRTVVPIGDRVSGGSEDPPPHCKLAIGVRTTNVERTLSPQAVHNGPETTRLWRAITERESFDRLGALEEPAAASYYPPDGPHTEGRPYDDARHLASLVRQNPRAHPMTRGDRRAIPAAALPTRSPRTGEPLVADAVDRYAAATGVGDEARAARSFVAAYAGAVVPPQLRLLSRYGVALESHLQNCYVVVEAGRPVGVLVRDFGGIRVHAGRLAAHGLSFDPYPDSDPEADGARDLHLKLYYALFQNHLGEVVAALARSTPVDARDCWDLVRRAVRSTFDDLRADPEVPEPRVDADERALLADPIPFKALTAMRLRGRRHRYVTSRVSNPLAADPNPAPWARTTDTGGAAAQGADDSQIS